MHVNVHGASGAVGAADMVATATTAALTPYTAVAEAPAASHGGGVARVIMLLDGTPSFVFVLIWFRTFVLIWFRTSWCVFLMKGSFSIYMRFWNATTAVICRRPVCSLRFLIVP